MRWIVVFIFTSLFAQAYSQDQHPYIKNLRAIAADAEILVSWTTKAGFTCQDIVVELSIDSLNFVAKETYFGLCGDSTERDYVLRVPDPFHNKKNFIRLDLGVYGYSYIISLNVIYVQSSLIIPHPANTSSVLYFKNQTKEELVIEFYTQHGELINRFTTHQDYFALNHLSYKPELIYYAILGENKLLYRGKLLFYQL